MHSLTLTFKTVDEFNRRTEHRLLPEVLLTDAAGNKTAHFPPGYYLQDEITEGVTGTIDGATYRVTNVERFPGRRQTGVVTPRLTFTLAQADRRYDDEMSTPGGHSR